MTITMVAQYVQSSNFASVTSPNSVSVTVAIGDILIIGGGSGLSTQIIQTPSGGGLTYTLLAAEGNSDASQTNLGVWKSSPAASNQTFNLSASLSPNNGADPWGFLVKRYSGVSAIGSVVHSHNDTTSAASLNITTSVANAVIDLNYTGFNHSSTSRVYYSAAGTFTETHNLSSTNFGIYNAGYYANAGPINTYQVGLQSPTNQWCMCVIELQPTLPVVAVNQNIIQSTVAVQNSYAY